MAKVRVQQHRRPMNFVVVDTEATKGATLGVDLYRADGSVVTEADLARSAPVAGSATRPS